MTKQATKSLHTRKQSAPHKRIIKKEIFIMGFHKKFDYMISPLCSTCFYLNTPHQGDYQSHVKNGVVGR
ncbi:hypothetical protein, partial [Aeromonas salmonicida]